MMDVEMDVDQPALPGLHPLRDAPECLWVLRLWMGFVAQLAASAHAQSQKPRMSHSEEGTGQ